MDDLLRIPVSSSHHLDLYGDRCLRLDLLSVLLNLDVQEKGHRAALHAELGHGIIQIIGITLILGQYLTYLQFRALRDTGLGTVVQGNLEGISLVGST